MKLKNMLFGYYETQCLYTVSKLNIADHLQSGQKLIAELAILTNTNEDKLYRVMRFMAAKNIFEELPNKVFRLNKESEALLSNSPTSLNHFIELHGKYFYNAASDIFDSMNSNHSAFKLTFDMSASDYFKDNKEAGLIYNQAMRENSELSGRLIAEIYDFSQYITIVDIGGGVGSLLANILLKNPKTQGINFDLPSLQEAAQNYFKVKGLGSRCQYIGGDFFKTIPSSGDLYIMKAILHGKTDKVCLDLLMRCKTVMPKNGKLLSIERIIDKDSMSYIDACINDINMLNVSSGHVRTQAEFDVLFKASGFLINKIYSLPNDVSIMELVIN